MYGDRGFHVNRFDEQPPRDFGGDGGTAVVDFKTEIGEFTSNVFYGVNKRIAQLETAQGGVDDKLNDFKQMLKIELDTKVGEPLRNHVKETTDLVRSISVSKNYMSFNDKRLVNVGRSIDGKDVVVRDEIIHLEKTLTILKDLVNAIGVIDSPDSSVSGVLLVKHKRRLSNVGKAVDPHDAVVKLQLDDMILSLNTLKNSVHQDFAKLAEWKRNMADTVSEMYEKVFGSSSDRTAEPNM